FLLNNDRSRFLFHGRGRELSYRTLWAGVESRSPSTSRLRRKNDGRRAGKVRQTVRNEGRAPSSRWLPEWQAMEADRRISDPQRLGHLPSAQNGRTGETEAITPSLKEGSVTAEKSASSDRLELSSFAGRLSEALTASSAGRAQRVAELK